MTLKESFRYQNHLTGLMNEAMAALNNRENCVRETKKHLRSKADSAAEDMTEVQDRSQCHDPDGIIAVMDMIVAQKAQLSAAIATAKRAARIDIDTSIELARTRRSYADALRRMLRMKAVNTTATGRAYKFNAEMNQTEYRYDIEVAQDLMFDPAAIKAKMKEILKEADAISASVDAVQTQTEVVGFVPLFDVNDTLDDILENMAAKKNEPDQDA